MRRPYSFASLTFASFAFIDNSITESMFSVKQNVQKKLIKCIFIDITGYFQPFSGIIVSFFIYFVNKKSQYYDYEINKSCISEENSSRIM